MRELDLRAYRDAFASIHGAFTMDAALLFFAYAELNDAPRGSVVEIGVHHGLSAIAVAALRARKGTMLAIDTFGAAQDAAASGGMNTDTRTFSRNMARFHGAIEWLRVIEADSRTLSAADLATEPPVSFFHIDGGHSSEETYHDLSLAAGVSIRGGLIALDDYFNPSFPGVSEGTVRYLIEQPGTLVPLAIGCNKVIFQRAPARGDLNARFAERYAFIPRTHATFNGSEVLVFGSGVAKYVDVERSTPARLVARELVLRVDLEPHRSDLDAAPGETVPLAVRVRNRSNVPLEWSDSPHGLSYHVLRADGTAERYENARTWFIPPLAEGAQRDMALSVIAPERPGEYVVEVDVVWEGICWLRERGAAVARVSLSVR
ncbi:MAG: class I SAM-dependent methyltransferase [Chloroflexi bacterium]|nr:class I SAM-dependent methyltransferase [Chloroflexota bacterium]